MTHNTAGFIRSQDELGMGYLHLGVMLLELSRECEYNP